MRAAAVILQQTCNDQGLSSTGKYVAFTIREQTRSNLDVSASKSYQTHICKQNRGKRTKKQQANKVDPIYSLVHDRMSIVCLLLC